MARRKYSGLMSIRQMAALGRRMGPSSIRRRRQRDRLREQREQATDPLEEFYDASS